MAEQDVPVTLTLAGIGRLANVGRAAVSNWRRRHDDFPAPVGGTDSSPQFPLPDIEDWLRRHGKVDDSVSGWNWLWPKVEDLGDWERMGLVLAAVGSELTGVRPEGQEQAGFAALTADERALVREARALAAENQGSNGFGLLRHRWLAVQNRQVAAIPQPLADTMAALAAALRDGEPVERVLDPSCGVGLLLEAAARKWREGGPLQLTGVEADPVLALLTRAGLAVAAPTARATVLCADALLTAPPLPAPADVVLCNPSAEVPGWSAIELAADSRWRYGLPAQGDPELAWVQHILSVLDATGVAVVLLTPSVASRRSGRRIRASLLRAGVIHGLIALPAGAASPYGVGLHLWLLRAPGSRTPESPVLFVDAADCRHTASGGQSIVDWDRLRERALAAVRGDVGSRAAQVPAEQLLADDADLTPTPQLAREPAATQVDLGRSWAVLDQAILRVRDALPSLRSLRAVDDIPAAESPRVTVAELERLGVLTVTPGAPLPPGELRRGFRPADAVEVLMLRLARHEPEEVPWLDSGEAARLDRAGLVALTAFGDVIVSSYAAEHEVWVETHAPRALGAGFYRLRTDPEQLDPFYLASCLRLSSNAWRAGSHARASPRLNVRRMRVARRSLTEQREFGQMYRRMAEFREASAAFGAAAAQVDGVLGALLGEGRIQRGS